MSLSRKTPLPRSTFKRAAKIRDDEAPTAMRTTKHRDVGVRRTALPKRNAKRKTRLFVQQFLSDEFVTFVKSQPCCVCGERGPNECAHVARSRGAGGRWTDTASLCRTHHAAEHSMGTVSFWKWARKTAKDMADQNIERWLVHLERM